LICHVVHVTVGLLSVVSIQLRSMRWVWAWWARCYKNITENWFALGHERDSNKYRQSKTTINWHCLAYVISILNSNLLLMLGNFLEINFKYLLFKTLKICLFLIGNGRMIGKQVGSFFSCLDQPVCISITPFSAFKGLRYHVTLV